MDQILTCEIHSGEWLERPRDDAIALQNTHKMVDEHRSSRLLQIRAQGGGGIHALVVRDDERGRCWVLWQAEFGVDLSRGSQRFEVSKIRAQGTRKTV